MADRGTCATCWHRSPDIRPEYAAKGNGSCRRYPPTWQSHRAMDGSGNSDFDQLWPYMEGDDWCGEYDAHHEVDLSKLDEIIAMLREEVADDPIAIRGEG